MGQSIKRKPQGQPRKIFTDEITSNGLGEGGGNTESDVTKSIEINLENINSKIHCDSSIGESIVVKKTENGLGAFSLSGILGFVSTKDKNKILQYNLLNGEISELIKIPLTAKVILHN